MIYSNLGKSEKARGTNLILHWNLKDSEKSHIEKKSTLAREISEWNWEASNEPFLQRFCVIPGHKGNFRIPVSRTHLSPSESD